MPALFITFFACALVVQSENSLGDFTEVLCFFLYLKGRAVLPIKFYWGWVMDFHQGVFQMNNLISSLPVFMECPWTSSMDMYSRLCHRLVSPSHETHVILYYLRYCHYSQLLPRLVSRQRLFFSFLATMTWLIP